MSITTTLKPKSKRCFSDNGQAVSQYIGAATQAKAVPLHRGTHPKPIIH